MDNETISVPKLEILPDPYFPDEELPPQIAARLLREANRARADFLDTYFEIVRHPAGHLDRRFTPEQHVAAVRAILAERSADWWAHNSGPADAMIANVCYQQENGL